MRYETISEYRDRLQSLKIKELGSGLYSTVFAHPTESNVAVKMVDSYDPLYLEFAKLCMKKPHNRWLPKIALIKPAKVKHWRCDGKGLKKQIQFIFLEKLKKASRTDIKRAMREMLHGTGLNVHDYEGNFLNFSQSTWKSIANYSIDPDTRDLGRIIMSMDSYRIDIHPSNVMMRGSQLVITDPIAS